MPRKKLIETAMPVSVINAETEKEKMARLGLPANVHYGGRAVLCQLREARCSLRLWMILLHIRNCSRQKNKIVSGRVC